MTNEEIVARIQNGEMDLLETLWIQVEKLVAWKAYQLVRSIGGRVGVELDDLYNCGYLAMTEAVKTYEPGKGSFSTWLIYYVKTAFADATGYRTAKGRNDPIRSAISLSAPIGEDDDGGDLSELIADPFSSLPYAAIENRIMFEHIQKEIAAALMQIPAPLREVVQRHYIEQKTLTEVGMELGLPVNEVVNLEHKAIRAMRQPHIAKRLRPLYENFDFTCL